MNQQQLRTIGFLCPKCRQSVMVQRDLFTLTAAPTVVPCPCGGSRLIVEYSGRDFKLNAPCAICGHNHTVTCAESDFCTRRGMAFSCQQTGLDCCYVGEEDVVCAALQRLEQRVDHLTQQENEREQLAQQEEQGVQLTAAQKEESAFLNEVVMTEMLGEIKDIAQRDGISCTCGSHNWKLTVHYASMELSCAQCGNILRLGAATLDDLDDLCCKQTLLIRGK